MPRSAQKTCISARLSGNTYSKWVNSPIDKLKFLNELYHNIFTMPKYLKSDLLYYNYHWTIFQKDDPRVSGEIDHTIFNRAEGNEVLYLIMDLMEEWGLNGKENGQKLERMIKIHLPIHVETQKEVKDWVFENWRTY